jgi:hypothetical protein
MCDSSASGSLTSTGAMPVADQKIGFWGFPFFALDQDPAIHSERLKNSKPQTLKIKIGDFISGHVRHWNSGARNVPADVWNISKHWKCCLTIRLTEMRGRPDCVVDLTIWSR